MKNALLRPAMIVLPLVVGALLPQAATLSFLIRWLLVGMLFMVCLQLEIRELKPRSCHWTILAVNVVIGLAGYFLFRLLGYRELALVAFFTGITPTATAAPVIMNFLQGNVGFVVSGFVVTNVGVSLALAVLIPLTVGDFSPDFFLKVLENLLVIMVLPLILASIVRRLHPPAAQWPKRFRMLTLSVWSLLLFIVAAAAAKFLRGNTDLSFLSVAAIAGISAALCAINFTVGKFIVPKEFCREGSQTLGQKNTMLTLYLAMTFASPLAALGPTFYAIFHNLWNACQLFAFDRHRNGK